jgi:hypothetical protein
MFSVAILSLRDATEEEIQSGVVGGFAAMGGGFRSAKLYNARVGISRLRR